MLGCHTEGAVGHFHFLTRRITKTKGNLEKSRGKKWRESNLAPCMHLDQVMSEADGSPLDFSLMWVAIQTQRAWKLRLVLISLLLSTITDSSTGWDHRCLLSRCWLNWTLLCWALYWTPDSSNKSGMGHVHRELSVWWVAGVFLDSILILKPQFLKLIN